MIKKFITEIKKWAFDERMIEAIILVGSYVKGTQKINSDIDLVVLTNNKQYYIDNPQIFNVFGIIDKINVEYYGECTSLRIWYKTGLEVEFGMVSLNWIKLPLDSGTYKVLSDGYKIIIDKNGSFIPITTIIPEYI